MGGKRNKAGGKENDLNRPHSLMSGDASSHCKGIFQISQLAKQLQEEGTHQHPQITQGHKGDQ